VLPSLLLLLALGKREACDSPRAPNPTSTHSNQARSAASAERYNRYVAQTVQSATRTVAVIGASSNRYKYGNKALRAFANQGFRVIAINPNEETVEGYRTYGSVLDVPGPIDMATLYVPPDVGVQVIEEIARKGIPEVWLNPGADGEAVVRRARELGLNTIQACSILAIGESPGRY
jgi:predicted CoA-binding protein